MQLKLTSWLGAVFTCTMVIGICTEAGAANPRIIVEVGQTIAGGWRVLGIGPAVAVNDARQVAYVAKIAKDGPVSIAVLRNRERVVWEGKRLADGAVVVDIEEDACPSINKSGEIAVPRAGPHRRAGAQGGDRRRPRADLDRQDRPRADDHALGQSRSARPSTTAARIAYFAHFEAATGPIAAF